MGPHELPATVRRLVEEREAARRDREFARADALRDRIVELGYRVADGPEGPTVEPAPPAAPIAARRRVAADVVSVLDRPPSADVSLHWVVEGWPEDVVRALDGVRRHLADREVHVVVSDLTEADPAIYGQDAEVLRLDPRTGWAAARNAGLKRATGAIVLVLDGSIEPTGDVLEPLEAALEDPGVGVCGPFGISTRDLHEFHESPGPEVDAVEGYLMAFRRDVLRDVGLFDERFRWYRTADIELSFRIRDAGYRALVVDVPVVRHEHRVWHATPGPERDRLSKRNYARFLERFRGRFDLLVNPPAS